MQHKAIFFYLVRVVKEETLYQFGIALIILTRRKKLSCHCYCTVHVVKTKLTKQWQVFFPFHPQMFFKTLYTTLNGAV